MDKNLLKLLKTEAVALATVNSEGVVNQAAVAGVKFREDKFLITDIYLGVTVENIKVNGQVSLLVWARDWEDSCISFTVKGKAYYLETGEEVEFVKNLEENKDEDMKGVIVISPIDIKKYA